jgi:hypothetical protein
MVSPLDGLHDYAALSEKLAFSLPEDIACPSVHWVGAPIDHCRS